MARGRSSNSHEHTSNLLSGDFKILVLRICICLDLPDYCWKVSWNISFLNMKTYLWMTFWHIFGRYCGVAFHKKTYRNGTITVLGIIALTAYKETSQQDYKSATGTVSHEPDLLSCEISLRIYVLIWQMNYCLSLSL